MVTQGPGAGIAYSGEGCCHLCSPACLTMAHWELFAWRWLLMAAVSPTVTLGPMALEVQVKTAFQTESWGSWAGHSSRMAGGQHDSALAADRGWLVTHSSKDKADARSLFLGHPDGFLCSQVGTSLLRYLWLGVPGHPSCVALRFFSL